MMKFIEPFLFFYSLSVYVFYSIFYQIMFQVICERNFNLTAIMCSSNSTNNLLVQSETSKWILYFNIGCIIPALFVPIFYSTIGPSIGSNRLLYLPVIGDTLSFGFVGLYEYSEKFIIWKLVILLSILNLFGGYSVTRALCNNYVSASSHSENREKRFQFVEIVCVLSYTLSGITGGYILHYLNIRAGIYICFSLMMLAFILLIFVKNIENKSELDKNETLISIVNIKEAFKDIPTNNRLYIVLFLISEYLTSFAESGALDILVLYCMRTEFQFSPLAIGWVLSTVHAVKAIGPLIIYPLLIRTLYVPAWIISVINQCFIIGYFLMLSFAKNKILIIVGAIFFLFDGSVSALISSKLSQSCENKSRGMVFGMHSAITEIGSVFGAVFADFIYLRTLSLFPGLTHLLLGVIMFFGCLLASIAFFIVNRNGSQKYRMIQSYGDEMIQLKS